jgi:translocation and assembly module TamA
MRADGRHAPTAVGRAVAAVLTAGLVGAVPPATAQAMSDATTAAEPIPASRAAGYSLDIEGPEAATALLTAHLDLARFRESVAAEGISGNELDRLVAAAAEQARALLRTAGWFSAEVTAVREPPPPGSTMPRVRITVVPGPQARVVAWQLRTAGDFDERLRTDDRFSLDTWVSVLRDWPLRPGDVFTQTAWSRTKDGVLATMRARGYPAATLRDTRAEVDVARAEVRLSGTVDSGTLYRLGPVRVEGLRRFGPASVLNLVDWGPGAEYTEKRLLDLQERLTKVGLFDGATVEIDTDPAQSQAAPVTVRVREATMQQATLGGGFSANTGPRVSLEHTHRRAFGRDWIVRNRLQLGRDERSWEGSAISHPLAGQYRALVSGRLEWLDAGDSIQWSRQYRVGGSLDTERIERLFFGELLQSSTRSALGVRSASALSGSYHLVWRDVDSVLLPTEGETANMQAGAGYALSDAAPNGLFARAYGRFALYRPIGDVWYFTGRLELGHVQAREAVQLPDALLFQAGGDESVRGYAYRSLGPERQGVTGSGRVLGTISVEIARPVSRRLPSVWGAAFIDAGQAADRWSDLRPVVGVGVGVRWRSPVGPLRVDVAWGEAVRRLRLHVSVGIAY